MAEQFPAGLPGALVHSQYTTQDLVDNNPLSSGPPVFRARADNGWMTFSVSWSLSALEVQIMRGWFRNIIKNRSKSFIVGLMVDGWDGTTNTKDHECYFQSPPRYNQNGRRWTVSADLLAIEEVTLNECDTISLIAANCGFENVSTGFELLDEIGKTLDERWAV